MKRARCSRPVKRRYRPKTSGPQPLIQQGASPDDLLTPAQAGVILKKSVGSLGVWRARSVNRGPAFIKIGMKVYYRRRDIEKYLSDRRVDPATRPAA